MEEKMRVKGKPTLNGFIFLFILVILAGAIGVVVEGTLPSWMVVDESERGYVYLEPELKNGVNPKANTISFKTHGYDFDETPEPLSIEDLINLQLGGRLKGMGASFVRYGREYNVDPVLGVAIAMQETGNGTSNALRDLNNVGGIMLDPAKGILRQFISINASIEYMFWLLRNSYMNGHNLYTIEEIGNRYCPVGADNDKKTNLNGYWIPNVTRFYEQVAKVPYDGNARRIQ